MNRTPERLLVIRFHAIGDVAITLPACAILKRSFPDASIEYLTMPATRPLVETLDLFSDVIEFPDCQTTVDRLRAVIVQWRRLRRRNYDLILDLQSNWVSQLLVRLLSPPVTTVFDRTSPLAAGKRVDASLASIGLPPAGPEYSLPVSRGTMEHSNQILSSAGWNGTTPLVVINPAGLWSSRQWPDGHYRELIQLILHHWSCQLLFLGTERIRRRAENISAELENGSVLNLVGQTGLGDALGILQHASLMISEDSGLMHMAWVSGIPTIALFGSSRHDWSRPLGPRSHCFHSGDLACGSCMAPTCRFGDVHCLARVTPQQVFDTGTSLMQPSRGHQYR